jgi:hypothetical protein
MCVSVCVCVYVSVFCVCVCVCVCVRVCVVRFQKEESLVTAVGMFVHMGRAFSLVIRLLGAKCWQAGDAGSILCRAGLYTFGCIHPAP